jgi:hypothetical protein
METMRALVCEGTLATYFSRRRCNLRSHAGVKSDACRWFVLQQHEKGVHRCEGLPVTSVRHSIDKEVGARR